MASLFSALMNILGRPPTDDEMQSPDLLEKASATLGMERQSSWTPEGRNFFGVSGLTPKHQGNSDLKKASGEVGGPLMKRLAEAKNKASGDSENKG